MFPLCFARLLSLCARPDSASAPLQVVELISGGAQIAVTNDNKMHYLNLLAQYRLASQVREEVEHFLKGTQPITAPPNEDVCRRNECHLLTVCRFERAGS